MNGKGNRLWCPNGTKYFEIQSSLFATLCSPGLSYLGLNSESLGATLWHLLNFAFGFSAVKWDHAHKNHNHNVTVAGIKR